MRGNWAIGDPWSRATGPILPLAIRPRGGTQLILIPLIMAPNVAIGLGPSSR